MVQPIYEQTPQIVVEMYPNHEAGEERGKLGGAEELLLGDMSAHNRADN